MKNTLFIFLTAVFFVIISCNKKLDIAPENTLVERDVFKTELAAEQALSEGYYNFMAAETNYSSYTYGDFTTPIVNKSVSYNSYDLGEVAPDDYIVVNTWTSYFKTINTANNLIAKIPLYGTFSEPKQKQFIAEAKFIRAACFFKLLCLFGDGALDGNMNGLGLPLQLTPFEGYNTGQIIPRSTNGEVFAQVIKDLTESVADLPERQADDLKTRSRATKGAANALLSRVYLFMDKYAESATAAKAVLDMVPAVYSLTNNLLQLFPSNGEGTAKSFTSEYIMGLPVSQLQSSSTSTSNGISGDYYFKRSFWISHDFINEFEPGDMRVTQLMWKGDSIYNPDRFNERTTFKFNNSFGRDNVSLMRLAEVMLTRAEALANTNGVNTESIELLNKVRLRSLPSANPFTGADFASKDELISKIWLQRKFELAFEGQYRYDLIRTGRPLHNPDVPANRKVLPVPQIEIDISKGVIEQNSGY
jgi:hypothetical protein